MAGPLSSSKLTGRPLLAVALRLKGASVVCFVAMAGKSIVWFCLPGSTTWKLRSTGGAGFQLASPAWVARMVTVPTTPSRVRVLPLRMAGPLSSSKLTGRPLVAAATKEKGPSVVSRSGGGGKLMVWSCGPAPGSVTVNAVSSSSLAVQQVPLPGLLSLSVWLAALTSHQAVSAPPCRTNQLRVRVAVPPAVRVPTFHCRSVKRL